MREEDFFNKFMREEFPKAGKIRRWWERKKLEWWLASAEWCGLKFHEEITCKTAKKL